MIEFKEFPKLARLNRAVIFTEKLDGTNAAVVVDADGVNIGAQSRSRLITEADDNHGFAKWVTVNREELLKLGPGHHFGEWWGQGIQRGYGLTEKRFSLFNVSRWSDAAVRPACCYVVPVILQSAPEEGFDRASDALELLKVNGSYAAPGFMKPEGIVAFHTAANTLFKATIERDQEWKGKQR